VVRQQLREGKSPEEVKAYFVSKYGEWILLEPKPSGANLLVYVLPIALVLGGAVFIWLMVKKWSRQSPPVEDVEAEDGLPV
jgi:cytochrome c-type biogenesis protein CcmH